MEMFLEEKTLYKKRLTDSSHVHISRRNGRKTGAVVQFLVLNLSALQERLTGGE